MTGPQFLALYWSALGLTILVGIALIVWVRSGPSGPPVDLDPYGIALLSGGWKRVRETALAGLVARGQVRVSRSSGYTPVSGARPADGFEDVVLRDPHGRALTSHAAMADSPAAVDLRRRMEAAGLVRRPQRAERAKKLGWVFLLLVVAGTVRLVMGISNDRPVGYLVGSLIATVVAWFIIVPWIASARYGPKPTARGRQALARARTASRGGGGAAMAVGAAVLLPVAFAGLMAYPDPEVSQAFEESERDSGYSGGGSGDSGSSDSGGSSCGSSCGGGGGCGGCGS